MDLFTFAYEEIKAHPGIADEDLYREIADELAECGVRVDGDDAEIDGAIHEAREEFANDQAEAFAYHLAECRFKERDLRL